jgi:hypothetical protein
MPIDALIGVHAVQLAAQYVPFMAMAVAPAEPRPVLTKLLEQAAIPAVVALLVLWRASALQDERTAHVLLQLEQLRLQVAELRAHGSTPTVELKVEMRDISRRLEKIEDRLNRRPGT